MTEIPVWWVPYEDRSSYIFSDETAVTCYLGKVYYFYSGRNAWQWTWSKKYLGSRSFHPTFESCRNEIQKNRVQGSTWRMREMPAVVVSGKEFAIVITEINTETPLKDFVSVALEKKTLTHIGDCFAPRKENSVVRFITNHSVIAPAELPFKDQRSSTRGPKNRYYLTWLPVQQQRDFSSVFDIVKIINQRLQNE